MNLRKRLCELTVSGESEKSANNLLIKTIVEMENESANLSGAADILKTALVKCLEAATNGEDQVRIYAIRPDIAHIVCVGLFVMFLGYVHL